MSGFRGRKILALTQCVADDKVIHSELTVQSEQSEQEPNIKDQSCEEEFEDFSSDDSIQDKNYSPSSTSGSESDSTNRSLCEGEGKRFFFLS